MLGNGSPQNLLDDIAERRRLASEAPVWVVFVQCAAPHVDWQGVLDLQADGTQCIVAVERHRDSDEGEIGWNEERGLPMLSRTLKIPFGRCA